MGGSEVDHGYGVAVDTAGNAYVTGKTGSKNFPIASAIYGSNSGDWDAFVTKLNTSGSLTFSTYLGGNGGDVGYGIAVDSMEMHILTEKLSQLIFLRSLLLMEAMVEDLMLL